METLLEKLTKDDHRLMRLLNKLYEHVGAMRYYENSFTDLDDGMTFMNAKRYERKVDAVMEEIKSLKNGEL